MKPFNKVAIIGVGLIGGSIGLAIRKKKLARQVIGVCRHKESLRRAKHLGAIDNGSLGYQEAVRDADLVILATPVSQIIKIGKQIAPYLKAGCLLTDVGSTKGEIVRNLEGVIPEGVYFVGAHPLAGSEKRGIAQADAGLWEGSICICTQSRKTKASAWRRVSAFWQRIGCRVAKLTPRAHDEIVSLISHLPHIAATQLVKTARKGLSFAASGFRDTTRIASSDAEVWLDICLSNKKFIMQAIDKYITQLKLMKGLICKGDKKRLSREFKRAKTLRDGLQK